MDSSPSASTSSSLAGRLKNRFRRSARHPEEPAGGPAPSATAAAAATAAASAAAAATAATAATSKSEEAGGSSRQEEPAEPLPLHPDLDDCAELSELLLTGEDEDEDDGEDAGGGRHQASRGTHLEQPDSQQQQVMKDLQAQLMALAIENEALRTRAGEADAELVRDLRRQLSAERSLRRRAEEAAADAATRHPGPISRAVARLRRRRSGPAATAAASATSANAASSPVPDGVDIESLDSSDSGDGGGSSDEDDAAEESPAAAVARRGRPPSLTERLKAWTAGRLLDLLEDLQQPTSASEASASEDAAEAPEDHLSARRLKANVTRFGRNARAPLRCLAGARDVLRWRWPSYTFAVAMTYYIALRYDLLLSLLLLLCIARLGLNYLKHRRHWAVEFNFLSAYENPDEEEAQEKERTVGTQVNFVVQVAKKVQNLTGKLSDNMEKFKNLITWRSPRHTQALLNALLAAFAVTAVLPASTCLYYAGMYMGFKLLVVNALFDRYPRLKRRHDSVARLWRSLPTDQQLSQLEAGKDVAKYVLPHLEQGQEGSPADGNPASAATDRRSPLVAAATAAASGHHDEQAFCQAFDLPQQERPLDRWRGGGKRCAIVCKDAERTIPLPSSLKHGRLYLTRSFLCFERSKDRGKARKRNLVIPLAMVRWARKTKPFAWFPGGGMAIEVQIVGIEKPITFGAIIGRDEAFDSLIAAGRKAGLAWAGGPSDGSTGAQQLQQQQQPDPQLVHAVNQALLSDSDLED